MPMRTVEDDDADRIANACIEGRDPLGLGRRYDAPDREHALQHAEDLLAGNVPVPDDAPRARLDDVSRALLAHEGCDPNAVAALASLAMGAGIVDGDGERIAIVEVGKGGEDVRRMAVHSGEISWHQDRTLEIHQVLPATIQVAVAGMPLSRVVSHPVLDRFALTIERVDGRLIRIAP